MKKRVSITIVLVMCLTLLVCPALAAESPSAAAELNGHYYERYDISMTWTQAKAYAESKGGYLVTITSQEEQDTIYELIRNGVKFQYWLGSELPYTWITGEEWTYDNWATPGYPDNYLNNERYLQMYRIPNPYIYAWDDSGKWNDMSEDNYIPGEEDFFQSSNVGFIVEYGSISSGWAQAELEKADELGLIPDSLKGQDLSKPITRAEFAAVSVRTYEIIANTTALPAIYNPFTDTNDIEVLKAYNTGITAGVSATRFEPDTLLNREQAATMLTRVFKRATIVGWTIQNDGQFPLSYIKPAAFADEYAISEWAMDSVYFMAAHGIIVGVGGNRFAPKNTTGDDEARGYANATREQALIIAVRMVEYVT